MKLFQSFLVLVSVMLVLCVKGSLHRLVTTDELENHISPEDLREFFQFYQTNNSTTTAHPDNADVEDVTTLPEQVDCFGLGPLTRAMVRFLNMKPDDADKVNTHFYFSSRLNPNRVQVYPDKQFGLEWVDYKPTRKTVMIVHGFMSHSNASWVLDMTRAFLEWEDVNVIAVDWSGGGNTWKYWRAVANTRRVGSDINRFLRQLMEATGANLKDFHFVGHSLGAHISSFASFLLGRVARITGLDPAQPCFGNATGVERLEASDADFVDIIHTNGRLLWKIGFGMPNPIGHVDFYPNGGMKQPGCFNGTTSLWSRMIGQFSPSILQQAVCSHGRAYALFTESLINKNCSFRAYRWDLSYEGYFAIRQGTEHLEASLFPNKYNLQVFKSRVNSVNTSLNSTCDRNGSCAEMGISALGSPKARGSYFLLTTDKEPYCVSAKERRNFRWVELLRDLRQGLIRSHTTTHSILSSTAAEAYADPDLVEDQTESTTTKGWFDKWVNKLFGG